MSVKRAGSTTTVQPSARRSRLLAGTDLAENRGTREGGDMDGTGTSRSAVDMSLTLMCETDACWTNRSAQPAALYTGAGHAANASRAA
jgi:hypothetical protein